MVFDKELQQIEVDPKWETADVDIENNFYPRKIIRSRLEMFKKKDGTKPEDRDLMQDNKAELKTEKEPKDQKLKGQN